MENTTAFVMTHESDPHRRATSLSVQALSLVRSLGRRGVRVVRLHPNHLDAGLRSRYCAAVEPCPDLYQSETRLLEFLEGLAQRHPGRRVLIPASDDCAWFLATHRERLGTHFQLPVPARGVMERIIDKRAQYEAAEALGVPVPETWYPESQAELRELLPKLRNYPYVIKPTVAHRWRLASMRRVSAGRKGIRVADARELLDAYEQLGAQARGVMLQEVIGGRDEQLYTFLGYFDRDARPLAYCLRSKIRQLPVDFGYCTLTVTCRQPQVQTQSLRLLRGLGYHGLVGVEWKLDPRTGLYKLIEINARAVNTIGIAAACGVDLPYIAYRDALGEPLPPVTDWRQGVKWRRFLQDWAAARTLHRQGRLSLGQWWRSLRGPAVGAVFAWDDPAPSVVDMGAFLRRRAGRRLSAMRRPAPTAGS
ncbi:ATP-grasp domain-containing protein [Alkalilimnicola sp. S0819]|uniref:carboxylate--amine ligase n=1 Tax=Alkalilimnicola sp. S0819 TaxID=2613922 RepID=UPI0012614790|nr:ATP-grasp domain-containing protein [Alkalilimnicola sp. S0819]KAB7627880.1 hypothetical protein F3N43_02585 [Alkalilimnicola sp. S0819]MPQ15516.1 hypothetical protein [Alkalilimnicola sp. S0819]